MKDGMKNEEGQKGGCTVTLECHLLACLRVPQPIQRVPAARRGLHCGVQLIAGLGPAALTDQRTPERRLRLGTAQHSLQRRDTLVLLLRKRPES